ncbi:MAG: hypothetical protein ACE37K_16305 [Planctomycetota bacterium]
MQCQLRIIRLLAIARIRSAGWAPWLLMLGWLAAARAQEPRMLRRFGIHILDDAVWAGGLLVLAVLLLAERRLPRRAGAATNLAMLAGLSILLMVSCWLLDQGAWSVGIGRRLLDATHFFAAYSPLAICLAVGFGDSFPRRLLSVSVVLVSLLTGSMLATAFRSEATALAWGAAGLSLLAAASWVSRREDQPKYL